MNLHDYTIENQSGTIAIRLNDPGLVMLEEFLNGDLTEPSRVDFYLNRFYFMRDHWNTPELEAYIKSDLFGYWDEDYMQEAKLEGHWFSIFSKEELTGGIHVEDKRFYLEPELFDLPTVSMSYQEFIDVLEQWKEILNHPPAPAPNPPAKNEQPLSFLAKMRSLFFGRKRN
jgi:hypothetical protein